jgi:hypothetical protein
MMFDIDVYTDLEKVQRLWRQHMAPTCFFDLWPVRDCFQREYNRQAYVLVASQRGRFRGMLALSWIEESQNFGFFPGEVWQGKTWLEQNKLLADSPDVAEGLLDQVPDSARIRYLKSSPCLHQIPMLDVDETGYLFYPKQYGFSFDAYMASFSGKTRKKMRSELNRLTAKGCAFRYDHLADIERMYAFNLERFQDLSYFSDERFLNAFNRLVAWLNANGMLRITTVLIGGKVAAVDLSAVWKGIHTVLAGGTHVDFPGVAKLINLHHMEWSCAQRFREVDFLCGDFSWKNRFHLTPRPLYEIWRLTATDQWQDMDSQPRTVCAVA